MHAESEADDQWLYADDPPDGSSWSVTTVPYPIVVYVARGTAYSPRVCGSVGEALFLAMCDLHAARAEPLLIRVEGVEVFDQARLAQVYAAIRPELEAAPHRAPALVARLAGEAIALVEAVWRGSARLTDA